MFKVVIDVTCVDDRPSGVGLYTLNLVKTLQLLQPIHNFELGIVYQAGLRTWLRGDFRLPDCLQTFSPHYEFPIPVRISNLLLNVFPQAFSWYLEPILDSADLVHGTNYTVFPYQKPLKAMSIYDLSFVRYPDYVDSVVSQYSRQIRQCLKWTDLVLTISESSKQDIIDYLGVDPSKIWVTPLASRYSDEVNFLNSKNDRISSQLAGLKTSDVNHCLYDFSKPYILFVSTLEPRKNITSLIQAFNYLKLHYKIEHQLVLVGRKGWKYNAIFEAIENSKWHHEIHHLDYLPDDLVAKFYQQADVFVYPSHYEGFGLPVLEAMTLGTPVVTSNTSSLPEVAGDAAFLIDPDNSIQLAEAILQVIADRKLRSTLITKGKQQAAKFSWQRTAELTLEAYRSLL